MKPTVSPTSPARPPSLNRIAAYAACGSVALALEPHIVQVHMAAGFARKWSACTP